MNEQPSVVIASLTLTLIMLVAGLINGVLSLLTFLNVEPRRVGCGIYLFNSSLTTLFTMIILVVKVTILLVAQMNYMNQRFFLQFQCISLDFLLRIGLNMDQWLNACVAMERSVATIQGVKFNKTKSKQVSKYIVVLLLLLNTATTLQDPIHRDLFDEDMMTMMKILEEMETIVSGASFGIQLKSKPSIRSSIFFISSFHSVSTSFLH